MSTTVEHTSFTLKAVHKSFIVVYSVALCEARKSSASSQIHSEIKQAKISHGMRYLLPCILWRAVFDYKDFLYSLCFTCHLFPIWTSWSPDLSDGARALFYDTQSCCASFLYTRWLHISGRKLTAFQQLTHGWDNILWVEERTRCSQCFTVTLSRNKFKSEAAAAKTHTHAHAHTGFSFKSRLSLTHQTRDVVCGCVLNMVKVSIKVERTIPDQHLAAGLASPLYAVKGGCREAERDYR